MPRERLFPVVLCITLPNGSLLQYLQPYSLCRSLLPSRCKPHQITIQLLISALDLPLRCISVHHLMALPSLMEHLFLLTMSHLQEVRLIPIAMVPAFLLVALIDRFICLHPLILVGLCWGMVCTFSFTSVAPSY